MKDYQLFIDCLSKLISFKSVQGPAKPNMPFGEEVYSAYAYFMGLAKDFGFKTIDYDGYAGEVVFGEGEEIGIIGHLDVVPVGNGWDTDPFTLTEIGDTFYARGIMDDKAPLLSCLFALKELKDSGVKPNKKFRLIVGCNEESGWLDVEYVKSKTTLPEYGFSPDGNFPVCYAEKGMAIIEFKLPKLKNFYGLTGGTVINAVCDYAKANCSVPQNQELVDKYNLKLTGNAVESFGKSAHGSKPELGVNALKGMFEYFYACGENVKDVLEYLFYDKAKIFEMENEQGNITFSPDLIYERDGDTFIKCDCRFPAPMEFSEICEKLDAFNLEYTYVIKHGVQYVEKQGAFIQTLLDAYNTVMGENRVPLSIGGSTFARVFKKGCAFGAEFDGENNRIHEPNERATKKTILNGYEIYKKAILELSKVNL